jgi:Tol biopolymer transport system component
MTTIAAWSPDGTRIAFASTRDGNYEIYVMNADGSAPRRLTNDPQSDYAPTWSPDGQRIAWRTNRDGNGEIYSMRADGTDARR